MVTLGYKKVKSNLPSPVEGILMDIRGKILIKLKREYEENTEENIITNLHSLVQDILANKPIDMDSLVGTCIGITGVLSHGEAVVTRVPISVKMLKATVGSLTGKPVHVNSYSRLALLAEHLHNDSKQASMLFISTSVVIFLKHPLLYWKEFV